MLVALPFPKMFERYNGMMMTPVDTDALEEAIAAAPVEDLAEEAVTGEISLPRPILVASR
ncbi:MAG: hypothetical protein WDM89_19920 [Rhizomicrobium sp.]